MEFIASLGVFGWVLIGLTCVLIYKLPKFIKGAGHFKRPRGGKDGVMDGQAAKHGLQDPRDAFNPDGSR